MQLRGELLATVVDHLLDVGGDGGEQAAALADGHVRHRAHELERLAELHARALGVHDLYRLVVLVRHQHQLAEVGEAGGDVLLGLGPGAGAADVRAAEQPDHLAIEVDGGVEQGADAGVAQVDGHELPRAWIGERILDGEQAVILQRRAVARADRGRHLDAAREFPALRDVHRLAAQALGVVAEQPHAGAAQAQQARSSLDQRAEGGGEIGAAEEVAARDAPQDVRQRLAVLDLAGGDLAARDAAEGVVEREARAAIGRHALSRAERGDSSGPELGHHHRRTQHAQAIALREGIEGGEARLVEHEGIPAGIAQQGGGAGTVSDAGQGVGRDSLAHAQLLDHAREARRLGDDEHVELAHAPGARGGGRDGGRASCGLAGAMLDLTGLRRSGHGDGVVEVGSRAGIVTEHAGPQLRTVNHRGLARKGFAALLAFLTCSNLGFQHQRAV